MMMYTEWHLQVDEVETIDSDSQKSVTYPPTKYTISRQKGRTDRNNFSNGWTKEGRKRYCDLMTMVNKNRAYFNSSFDKRMMKYAQKRSEQQKRKQKWKSSTEYIFPTEMSLPSPKTIQQQNLDEAASKENMELMEYNIWRENFCVTWPKMGQKAWFGLEGPDQGLEGPDPISKPMEMSMN